MADALGGPDRSDLSTRPISRPVALGYLQVHVLMTPAELARTKQDLEMYARRSGYTLGSVFVEQLVGHPSAYAGLLVAAHAQQAGAIVLPSLAHLAVLDDPANVRARLEERTRARVLVATEPTQPAAGTIGAQADQPSGDERDDLGGCTGIDSSDCHKGRSRRQGVGDADDPMAGPSP